MKRQWLIDYRKKKKLTQHEVAKICDVTTQAYSQYENGNKRPKPEIAQKLGKLLEFKWTRFYD